MRSRVAEELGQHKVMESGFGGSPVIADQTGQHWGKFGIPTKAVAELNG
jgi:hypothetical protein